MSRKAFILAAVFTFIVAAPIFAQQNEIGGFISWTQLDSTDLTDPDFPDDEAELDFESDLGYGVAYNRYWTDAFSTEFGAQQVNAQAELRFEEGGVDVTIDAGDVDLTVFTAIAQLHFGTGFIAPYIGAGVAHISGSVELPDDFIEPGEPTSVDFESETTWVANAGIDFRLGSSVAIGADVKYIAYEAAEEGFEDFTYDVNPLIFAAGVKFRF